jgi:hypothetical protein
MLYGEVCVGTRNYKLFEVDKFKEGVSLIILTLIEPLNLKQKSKHEHTDLALEI